MKGADDFTWKILTFTVAGNPGVLTADDVPGAVINLTLKRVEPA